MRRIRRLLLTAFIALGLAPVALGYGYIKDWSPEPPGREQAADVERPY
jgi:hypothetical protein